MMSSEGGNMAVGQKSVPQMEVSGHMDQNLRSPGGFILIHTHMGGQNARRWPKAAEETAGRVRRVRCEVDGLRLCANQGRRELASVVVVATWWDSLHGGCLASV